MARDAIPGDSPRSVSAGPSTAFRRAAAQARRLQGVSASADSYCGPALTLTTARISNVNNSDINPQFDVPVAEGLHPCLSSPSSARTAALIASGAGETQGRVGLSRRFIQSGTGSQLVDLQVVQMSSTFGLPEEGALQASATAEVVLHVHFRFLAILLRVHSRPSLPLELAPHSTRQ